MSARALGALSIALPPLFVLASSCGSPPAPAAAPMPARAVSLAVPPPAPPPDGAAQSLGEGASDARDGGADAAAEAEGDAARTAAPGVAACPEDMILVDGTFCPRVERTCLRKELNKPNHITICHKFEHTTRCLGREERHTFCIDPYEYPNRKGAHPPWMVSWYDAEATCRSKGKRLCYESEWVTACEGPDHTPFPYGWDRDQTACNIDNTWINPRLERAYSKDHEVSEEELERLDQSVASGAMDRCVSGYGVHDMTGNFDEWVTSDSKPREGEKSEWAGLKGGAWGHVRNACRPMTTSHPPDFTYYFISFRCCADAGGAPVYRPPHAMPAPPVKPGDRAPLPPVKSPAGPSSRKVQPEN